MAAATNKKTVELGCGQVVSHVNTDFAPYLISNDFISHLDDLKYTVTSKKAQLFRMPTNGLSDFNDLHEKVKQMALIDSFLKDTLPDYQYKSKKARNKMVTSFELQEYCAGVTLIKEGESLNGAYFIVEGEIKLLKKSANSTDMTAKAKKPPKLIEIQQPKNSLTTKES